LTVKISILASRVPKSPDSSPPPLALAVVGNDDGPATRPAFGNAVIHVTRNKRVQVRDNDVVVTATVGLLPNGKGGFALTVELDVTIAGVEQATAESIVHLADEICPYSNAVRGNVDVILVAHAR
jgi:hypothetical protein